MQLIDIRNFASISPAQGREWLSRPVLDTSMLEQKVADILLAVRDGGDEAVRNFTLQFDKVTPEVLQVSEEELAQVEVDGALRDAIHLIETDLNRCASGSVMDCVLQQVAQELGEPLAITVHNHR